MRSWLAAIVLISCMAHAAPPTIATAPTPAQLASQVPVLDGIVQPRRPLPDAIADGMRFFKKSDEGYVPGKLDGPLAGYFTRAHVLVDGTPSSRIFCFPARQHAYFITTFLLYH